MELVKTDGHPPTVTPKLGTARTIEGKAADLLNPWHYPVRAVCMECGKMIVADNFFSDWHHFG